MKTEEDSLRNSVVSTKACVCPCACAGMYACFLRRDVNSGSSGKRSMRVAFYSSYFSILYWASQLSTWGCISIFMIGKKKLSFGIICRGNFLTFVNSSHNWEMTSHLLTAVMVNVARLQYPDTRSNANPGRCEGVFKMRSPDFEHSRSTSLMRGASSNQLRALREKDRGPVRKREFFSRRTLDRRATSSLPWVSSPLASPVDFRPANLQSHTSQLLKINLCFSLSCCLSLSLSIYT